MLKNIDFEIIGIMSVLYTVARLLQYWVLLGEDTNNNGFMSKIATGIVLILWLLSLPVTIVFYFLNKWHTDRLVKIAKQEEWEHINQTYDLTWKTTSSSSDRPRVCIAKEPPLSSKSSQENNLN